MPFVQMPFNYDQESGVISIPLPGATLLLSLETASNFFLQGLAFCMGVQKALLMAHDLEAMEVLDNPVSVVEDVVHFLKQAGGASGENP